MTSKHLNISAVIFFVVAQILLFLGLNSEQRSATNPLCTAAMICLATSVTTGILGLRRAAREKRQKEETKS